MYCDVCYRTGLPLAKCCNIDRCPPCHEQHVETDHRKGGELAADRDAIRIRAARAA